MNQASRQSELVPVLPATSRPPRLAPVPVSRRTTAPIIDAIITSEVIAEIHAAIRSLPENYRTISVKGFLEGKKNQEIADELGMSVNTVKKQKQKALQLLRLKLTPDLFALLLWFTA